jgi:hypothetical protein
MEKKKKAKVNQASKRALRRSPTSVIAAEGAESFSLIQWPIDPTRIIVGKLV